MEEKLAAAAAAERSLRRRPPVPRAAPWLVFSHGKNGKDQTFYNLCEPTSNKTYRKCIPEIDRKSSFWQSPSHQGWLVILCDEDDDNAYSKSNWKFGDSFLFHPVSLETIQLPTLHQWIKSTTQLFVVSSVLSSPPSNPNSMVFFLIRDNNHSKSYLLLFCRPGEDKQWRTQYFSDDNPVGPLVCFEGNKLYIMCRHSDKLREIEKFDPEDETLSIRLFDVSDENPPPLLAGLIHFMEERYVESCNELFKVVLISHVTTCKYELVTLQILRMNFSLMAWVEVESLGDRVLFLGENTRGSCSAAELGLTRGCVYFTRPKDKSLYKFDLEEGTISVSLPCENLPTPWFSPSWMLIPTRVNDGRRGKEDMLGNNQEELIVVEVEEIKTSIYNNDEKEEEIQKNNGGKLEKGRSCWDTINEDILELIASYLHPIDYLRFHSVCKSNRSATPLVSWRTSSTVITQTTYLSPWLVFYEKNDAIYNFLNPMHDNEKYFMNLHSLLLYAKIRFSKDGWLLMSKGDKTIFFFNPFTRAMIRLPDLPSNYCFSGISFSSSPTSSDCAVIAIGGYGKPTVRIFSISRGDDSWWIDFFNYTELPSKEKCMEYVPCRNNPVFYNGAFYCLDYNGALGVFDVEDDYSWEFLSIPQRPCNSINESFLVECGGDLLSVFLGSMGKWIRIFRLDFSKKVWVEVESLGKHMLFISHTSCLAAVAPDSHMKNKIYFPRFHDEGIVFYSLDTGRYHSLGSHYSAQDFYNTKERLYCSWIEPNWSQTTDEELDWLVVA